MQQDSIQEEPPAKEQDVDIPVHLTDQVPVDNQQESEELVVEISEPLKKQTNSADTQPIVEPISEQGEEVNSEVLKTTPNNETTFIFAEKVEAKENQQIQLKKQTGEAVTEPSR